MNSAKVAAAAAIAVVTAAAAAVGAILTGAANPEAGFPDPVPLSFSDVTSVPPMRVVSTDDPVPVEPPLQTADPAYDPDRPPAVEVWGNPELRPVDLLFSGFAPHEVVVVANEGREAARMETGDTGHARFRGFDYHLTLPGGHHEFVATGQTSERSVIFALDVFAPVAVRPGGRTGTPAPPARTGRRPRSSRPTSAPPRGRAGRGR
ncbi:hypothetical protein [Herbidospora cretacea]|uniref:hypothetical protein n=1 Tax=Herbidospora cretacea TaxID=28444 RepID=UPI000A3E80B7|nr:hypothetical protein [Herbidospora cretacea]